ncbi:hypothetical protein [Streptomyces drozdowiczii]|uniref:Uncharacterized protein n=1 Tax=Streptomyces drozdowiczii TaxID=202862 RepID=A0ABY6PVK5_9ACTN|nr:hypothetical protein [Streptomyces drozdowiczii]MCX0244023.1 hypothetical protein [Streptomyces drozdowiczii]UZK56141.1 hypothetical protein NEH16_20370 [Streptomyces drozdowiczii]
MSNPMLGPLPFFLIAQYDTLKEWEKPNFLTSIGRTHAYIERLRALRDAAEGAREPAPESPRPDRSSQRRARSPRRPRVTTTRPRNRTDIRFTSRRRVPRTYVYVIFVERD